MKRRAPQPIFLISLTLAALFGVTPPSAAELPAPAAPKKTPAAKSPAAPSKTAAHAPAPSKALPAKLPKPTASLAKKAPTKAPALEAKKYYQVQPGETLYSISVKTGQVFQNLAQWNRLPSPYRVSEGQTLQLFEPPEEPVPEQKQANPIPAPEKRDAVQKFTIPPLKKTAPNVIINPRKASNTAAASKSAPLAEKKRDTPVTDKKMVKLGFRWPITGRILRSFAQSNKQGIDIESKNKQSVVAAAAGRVVYIGQGLSNLKNLLIIQHNGPYLTAYANNSRILVKEDQNVAAGQAVAEIGTAANGPYSLHFQIRKNGTPVDPLNFLAK